MIFFYAFINRFCTIIPYYALFLSKEKRFSDSEVVIFFAIYTITIFALEVPTGILTDKEGSRFSLFIGQFLRCLSLALLVFGNIILCMMSQIILAMGDTFLSGSEEMYYFNYYTQNQENIKKGSFDEFYSKLNTLSWLGIAISFFIGSLLAEIDIGYVIMAGALGYVLSFSCVLFMKKLSDEQSQKEPPFSLIKKALIDLKLSKSLKNYFISASLINASLAALYLLFQPYMISKGFSGSANGIIYGFATIFASIGSRIAPKLSKKMFYTFIFYFVLILLGIAVSLNESMFLFILLFCLFRFVWGFYSSVIISTLSVMITSGRRATIFSLHSLSSSLFESIFLFGVSVTGVSGSNQIIIFLPLMIISFFFVIFLNRKTVINA